MALALSWGYKMHVQTRNLLLCDPTTSNNVVQRRIKGRSAREVVYVPVDHYIPYLGVEDSKSIKRLAAWFRS